MDKDSRKALKAGVWYTISNFLSRGLVFFTTPIFTRILSTSEFGEYSNFATWQNILMILVTLELSTSVARAKYDYENEIDEYISSITISGTLFTFICYLIVIIGMPFFANLFSLKPLYIHIMFLYLLVAPALQILQAKNRIFLKYKSATILTVTSSILSVVVAIITIYLSEDKLFGRIFGQQVVLITFDALIFFWIVYQGKCFKGEYIKYAIAISMPLIPHLLAGNLLGAFDKIVIKKLCGVNDLAFYSLAFNCALIAKALWDSLNQAMVPWLYDNLAVKNYSQIKKISRMYLIAFLYISLGIMLVVPEVVLIFGGTKYLEAKYVMPPIVMGCCFQFAYALYVNVEMFQKKTVLISVGTICAALLNIPLNYYFVGKYGYISAAYTTMFCYGLLLLFHYLILRKTNMSFVYSNRFNFICLLGMCAITIAMEYVYSVDVIRYILIIMYTIISSCVIYRFRKTIITIISKKRSK